jgi:hypothetical protein
MRGHRFVFHRHTVLAIFRNAPAVDADKFRADLDNITTQDSELRGRPATTARPARHLRHHPPRTPRRHSAAIRVCRQLDHHGGARRRTKRHQRRRRTRPPATRMTSEGSVSSSRWWRSEHVARVVRPVQAGCGPSRSHRLPATSTKTVTLPYGSSRGSVRNWTP